MANEAEEVVKMMRKRWWMAQRWSTYSIWAVRRLNPLAIE